MVDEDEGSRFILYRRIWNGWMEFYVSHWHMEGLVPLVATHRRSLARVVVMLDSH